MKSLKSYRRFSDNCGSNKLVSIFSALGTTQLQLLVRDLKKMLNILKNFLVQLCKYSHIYIWLLSKVIAVLAKGFPKFHRNEKVRGGQMILCVFFRIVYLHFISVGDPFFVFYINEGLYFLNNGRRLNSFKIRYGKVFFSVCLNIQLDTVYPCN